MIMQILFVIYNGVKTTHQEELKNVGYYVIQSVKNAFNVVVELYIYFRGMGLIELLYADSF